VDEGLVLAFYGIRYAVRPQSVGVIHDADECRDETCSALRRAYRPHAARAPRDTRVGIKSASTGSHLVLACPEIRGFRAAVLTVRIHFPPAESQQTFGSGAVDGSALIITPSVDLYDIATTPTEQAEAGQGVAH
jgi:hypothetical protein